MRSDKSGPARLPTTALALLLCFTSAYCHAKPKPVALVLGNSDYVYLPDLDACLPSARQVREALRGLGFQVLERQDSSSGGLAATIGQFLEILQDAPDSSVFIYFCGYGAGMNDRPFVLPVSANLRRETDVLTQGVLVKVIADLLERGKVGRGILAMDLTAAPEIPSPPLEPLSAMSIPEGTGLVVVTSTLTGSESSALALAIRDGLAIPAVRTGTLLSAIETGLQATDSVQVAALRRTATSLPLAAVAEPPPLSNETVSSEPPSANEPRVPASSSDSESTTRQASAPSLDTRSPQTAPTTIQRPRGPVLPDEDEMTDGQLRLVQEALSRVGYYSGEIDGIFGRETRAAIRRFQYEIGGEMTGNITGEQATRLVTWK